MWFWDFWDYERKMSGYQPRSLREEIGEMFYPPKLDPAVSLRKQQNQAPKV